MNHLLNTDELSLVNMFHEVDCSYTETELCGGDQHKTDLLSKMLERGYVVKNQAEKYHISAAFRDEIARRLRHNSHSQPTAKSAENLMSW